MKLSKTPFINCQIIQTDFNDSELADYIHDILSHLNQQLEGFALLGCAPEPVVAKILSIGEYLSVNIFSQILTTIGQVNSIIDPADMILAEGDYLVYVPSGDWSAEIFPKGESAVMSYTTGLIPGTFKVYSIVN